MNKLILTVKHGRPSTATAFASMNDKDALLVQRRQVKKGGVKGPVKKEYFRVFNRENILSVEEIEVNKISGKKLLPFGQYTKVPIPNITLEDSIVVRWGSRQVLPTNKSTIVYNKSENINFATNKHLSRKMFIDNKVSCPILVTPENVKAEYLPIICRPHEHSKGKNFIVLKTIEDFKRHYNPVSFYYSNFIDKKREFRIHVAHSKALAVMEKVKPEGNGIAWNRAQNDTDPFEYIKWGEVDNQNLKEVLLQSIKAVNCLGLDFGGVDVMLDDTGVYVLEVNTSPTLNSSPYVASRWGQYFDWLFRRESRRDHWEFDKYEKGSSLIWKNFQLKD